MDKKHVVYWGQGCGRVRMAFLAREPAEQYYVTMLASDSSAELLEQTDAEAAASGTIDLHELMFADVDLTDEQRDGVVASLSRGSSAATELAKDERDGSS